MSSSTGSVLYYVVDIAEFLSCIVYVSYSPLIEFNLPLSTPACFLLLAVIVMVMVAVM